MKRLFIIGNGFDRHHCDNNGERMKTAYCDFRDYLTSCFPDWREEGVPQEGTIAGGDYGYNEDEVVGYIIKTLNGCSGEKWSNLEESLGNAIFDEFSWEFVDENEAIGSDNDNDMFRAAYANEDLSVGMNYTFRQFRELFEEWVNGALKNIDYEKFNSDSNIKSIFDEADSEFITFNYTFTLERLYGISEKNIHHFHGKIGDQGKDIIFGHGDSKENISSRMIGAEDNLKDLKCFLHKDTDSVIRRNIEFFESLKDVTDIYSFGFSFSDVDMTYIEKLSEYLEPSNLEWHLNEYDRKNNPDYENIIKKLGYNVNVDVRW